VRWDANNINTVNEMIGSIAHTDIVQKADRVLELEEHACHGVNLAGVHIDENPPHAKTFHIEMPTT
jgi:ACT domain-containing protein